MNGLPEVSYISACRICGSHEVKEILRFEQMPLTDAFIGVQKSCHEFLSDIIVYKCESCSTVQTQHNVDVKDYYEDYQYSVGASQGASQFMNLLAGRLLEQFFPEEPASQIKVLEVGSGDGAQLESFKNLGCSTLGYEPSSVLCSVAADRGIVSVQGLFDDSAPANLPVDFSRPDIILLSYTFDHLPDPAAFLKSVQSIINNERGLLVVEVHDLDKIFERAEFCLFEHEHSIYLNRATAKQLLERAGFSVLTFDLLHDSEKRANSLLFVAAPKGGRYRSDSELVRLPSDEYYESGVALIQKSLKNLDRFATRYGKPKQVLAGYGAGGRGIMTLAAMKEFHRFSALIDRNPKGPGILAPKSHIPTYNLSWFKDNRPDAVLIFSFGYLEEIVRDLSLYGIRPEQLFSLVDILKGEFRPIV